MSGVNKAIILGNLGAAPEVRFLPSGQAVCDLRVATNESFTDKNQQKQKRTEWHRIVVWGKTAENCAKYLQKGRQVYVEGRIQTRTYDDKNTGEKRYMTEIVANVVQFLGGKDAGRGHEEGPPDDSQNSGAGYGEGAGSQSLPPNDDDIPF